MLTTARLKIQEFDLADAPFILLLLNNPTWLDHIGDRKVHSLDDARNYLINGPLKSYSHYGFGLYKVSLKDGTPIGMCGFVKRNYLDYPDLGYAILPQYAGQGYIVEAAGIVLSYGLSTLRMTTILAITTHSNPASIYVLKKVGMQFIREIEDKEKNVKLMLFQLMPQEKGLC